MRGGSKSVETLVAETPLKGRRIWQELPALPWEIWVEDIPVWKSMWKSGKHTKMTQLTSYTDFS